MIIAVDFDGVLHDHKHPIEGRKMGEPLPDAFRSMRTLKWKGHKLIIHSVRGGKPDVIRDWCKFYKIPFDEITNIKPNADIYLDDKALHFNTWADSLLAIKGWTK